MLYNGDKWRQNINKQVINYEFFRRIISNNYFKGSFVSLIERIWYRYVMIHTRNTATKLVGELLNQVVIEAIFQRTKDDDGSCVFQFLLCHTFVRQDHVFCLAHRFSIACWRITIIPIKIFPPFEWESFGKVEATLAFGTERCTTATLKSKQTQKFYADD